MVSLLSAFHSVGMSDISRRFSILSFTLVAVLGGFLFGFDSGVINGTVDAFSVALGSNAAVTGFNVASMLLGCAVGALVAGRMADRFGRRLVLIVAAIGLAGLAMWLANFAITFTFPMLLAGLGLASAYLICGGFAIVSFFFVRRAVTETSGRELENMGDK